MFTVKSVGTSCRLKNSPLSYIRQGANDHSKGPFRGVGRNYGNYLTYANFMPNKLKIYCFCELNTSIEHRGIDHCDSIAERANKG